MKWYVVYISSNKWAMSQGTFIECKSKKKANKIRDEKKALGNIAHIIDKTEYKNYMKIREQGQ